MWYTADLLDFFMRLVFIGGFNISSFLKSAHYGQEESRFGFSFVCRGTKGVRAAVTRTI